MQFQNLARAVPNRKAHAYATWLEMPGTASTQIFFRVNGQHTFAASVSAVWFCTFVFYSVSECTEILYILSTASVSVVWFCMLSHSTSE